jgi:catechol 2,3-dioxygenase-like lactoylglutathione lyase family enzyme
MHRFVTNLLTRDVERSAAFYRALAGLTEIRRGEVFIVLAPTNDSAGQLCLIDWVSELVPRAARGLAEGTYLSLVIEDVAAAVAVARRFEVEIIEATSTEGERPTQAIIRDLDGRVIELVTPAAHLAQVPRDTVA